MLSQVVKKWSKIVKSAKKCQKVTESEMWHPDRIQLIRNAITHLVYVVYVKLRVSGGNYKHSIYYNKWSKSAKKCQY